MAASVAELTAKKPFSNSIFTLANLYHPPRPTAFSIGSVNNAADENQLSAQICHWAIEEGMRLEETLLLFGEHYQQVLQNPDGTDHANIRALMEQGLEKVRFEGEHGPLTRREQSLESTVTELWGQKPDLEQETFPHRNVIIELIELVEAGKLGPVAVNPQVLSMAETLDESKEGIVVYPWVKKGLLLGLQKLYRKRWIDRKRGECDVLPVHGMTWKEFADLPIADVDGRYVPGGARRGSCKGDVPIMPGGWINSGAVVGNDTMVDRCAGVGSCAYVGEECHISANAGIGGVFEPYGAIPVVVGDRVFIGVGSEPTEGCIIGSGAVLAPNVILTSGTKIIDARPNSPTKGEKWHGFVPHDALVVPGTYQRAGSNVFLACAYLLKDFDPRNRGKVDINEELRQL